MSQLAEFRRTLEELDKQRSLLLASGLHQDPDTVLAKKVVDTAHNQLSAFETINDFHIKLAASTWLKERVETNKASITLPSRESVTNFIGVTRSALEMHKEVAALGGNCELDTKQFEGQRVELNRLLCSDVTNSELNRCLRDAVNFYTGQPETEELGDSTVNTIVSEDVLTSSPL